MQGSGFFDELDKISIDEAYPRFFASNKDTSPEKIALLIGMYRTEEQTAHTFNVVKKVE